MIKIFYTEDNAKDLTVFEKAEELAVEAEGWCTYNSMASRHIPYQSLANLNALLKKADHNDLWLSIVEAIKPIDDRTDEGRTANLKTYAEASMINFIHLIGHTSSNGVQCLFFPEAMLAWGWQCLIARLLGIMTSEYGRDYIVTTHSLRFADLVRQNADVEVITI
jgi:hypothetical protein